MNMATENHEEKLVDDLLNDVIDEDEFFEPLEELPPLESLGDEEQSSNKDGVDNSKKVTEKKRQKSARPLLNEGRLLSENGINALPSFFENVKFKGKGHEASDLKLLLKRYEYWAHNLFPKGRFEDVVEKVEDICSRKKRVKLAMNDMRLGIMSTNDDEDNVHRREDEINTSGAGLLNVSEDQDQETLDDIPLDL